MKFASYDEIGNITGYYDDQIHTVIPVPNIALTHEEWLFCVDNRDQANIRDEELFLRPERPSAFHDFIDDEWVLNLDRKLKSFIRPRRNDLLAETDKYMLSDYPITEEKRQEYVAYRQQLRDFPSVCDIENPEWPVKPE